MEMVMVWLPKVVVVMMPLDGVMVAALIKGAVFSTVTAAEAVVASALSSVTVTVQVMRSPGLTKVGSSVMLAPEPRDVPPFVHA